MLPALGPVTIPPAGRTVVIGVPADSGRAAVERAAAGADAVWLRLPTTPDRVATLRQESGLPVGVTTDGIAGLGALVAAGAVALECGADGAFALAAEAHVAVWCAPDQAEAALRAGVPAAHLIVEGAGGGVQGATVEGAGPAAWGAVVRAVRDGALVVRTTDARSVRRVLAVTDRLRAARARADAGAGA